MDFDNYSERLSLGIDTFEKSIVYSALLLRTKAKSNINIYLKKISSNEGIIPYLAVDILLPYEQDNYLKHGGSVIPFIIPFSTELIKYLGKVIPSNNNIIPQEPDEVNSLEKYLAWTALGWVCLNKQYLPQPWENYGYFAILDGKKPPSLSIKILLEFDYEKYAKNDNLIECVISSDIPIDYDKINTLIGVFNWNNILFGNNLVLTN